MEETSEELPNFSIGIDLLGLDPTSTKNKAEKTRKLHVSQICRKTSCSKFWPKDIHWEQKITNWSLTTFKGKISVFIVVFCTLHGSVTLFRTIKTLDNFGSLTFKTFFRDI